MKSQQRSTRILADSIVIDAAKEALDAISPYCVHPPVVAGGFIRNHVLKLKPSKDIDIFINQDELRIPGRNLNIKKRGYATDRNKYINRVLWDKSHCTIDYVLTSIPVEEFIHKTFDFGINKVWYDGKTVYASDCFFGDIASGVLSTHAATANSTRLTQNLKRVWNATYFPPGMERHDDMLLSTEGMVAELDLMKRQSRIGLRDRIQLGILHVND